MKRLIFKMLVVSGVAVGGAFYILYLQTGQMPSLLSGMPSFAELTSKTPDLQVPDFLNAGSEAPAGTVYKWRDADGVSHFSNTPPEGVTAEVLHIDPNVNTLPALKSQQVVEESEQQTQQNVSPQPKSLDNPYSPEGVKALLDKANSVEKTLQDRAQQQRELVEQL